MRGRAAAAAPRTTGHTPRARAARGGLVGSCVRAWLEFRFAFAMSRRSRREKPKKTADSLPVSVKRGLASLIHGNETVISGMLDMAPESDLLGALIDVLAVNSLSAEGLLAQWFSAPMLSAYAASIGKSPKGNEITLAARIASAWASPSFQPPAVSARATDNSKAPGQLENADDGTASGDGGNANKRKRGGDSATVETTSTTVQAQRESYANKDGADGERHIRGVINTRHTEGRMECKVRWEGCDKSEDSWVDREAVSSEQLAKYEERKRRKQQQKLQQD